FFDDPAATAVYPLSLHDALPILSTSRIEASSSAIRIFLLAAFMLEGPRPSRSAAVPGRRSVRARNRSPAGRHAPPPAWRPTRGQIGRASCRERAYGSEGARTCRG